MIEKRLPLMCRYCGEPISTAPCTFCGNGGKVVPFLGLSPIYEPPRVKSRAAVFPWLKDTLNLVAWCVGIAGAGLALAAIFDFVRGALQ